MGMADLAVGLGLLGVVVSIALVFVPAALFVGSFALILLGVQAREER